MNLKDLRNMYPQYDDLSDEELLGELDLDDKKIEPIEDKLGDTVLNIEERLNNLCQIVKNLKFPDTTGILQESSQSTLEVMKQIKNQLKSLEVAVKAIDVSVNIPAPVVNIPAQKQLSQSPIIIPEPIKEWTFEIKRDRNGYIHSVVAKG